MILLVGRHEYASVPLRNRECYATIVEASVRTRYESLGRRERFEISENLEDR